VPSRVRLLMKEGASCYRTRRDGERKRKSVRGCIVSAELSVLNLVVLKTGEKEITGLSNPEAAVARRLGPKRASKIRKLFNLQKQDDVRKYVIRRKFEHKGKKYDKAPKIQRLVTPVVLQRKRQRALEKNRQRVKTRQEAAEYQRLHAQRVKEQKDARRSSAAARRSSRKASEVKA
jgi:small subunit ribosomal protein S6e